MTSARGAHIVAAALDVIAAQGIDGASLRTVATAAGVSLAQVQYYFRSKDELIRAGFAAVSEQYLAAVEDHLHDLRETVWRWLPLDEEREKWSRVWLAYTAISVTNAELAQESATTNAELRGWLTDQLHDQTAAAQLLALVDGYTVQALCLPIEERAELAERTLGAFLEAHSPS